MMQLEKHCDLSSHSFLTCRTRTIHQVGRRSPYIFDDLRITIRAMTDTSELSVDTKELSAPVNPEMAGCYRITDISDHQLVASFIGKSVFDWWSLTNDAGYRDGFMIAFSSYNALCCIAMNNVVSILNAAGEQCA